MCIRDSSASVTSLQNAIANGTSAQAGYGVAVNANGAVAGMYLMVDSSGNEQNNTSTSNIIFEADQVTIRNPHGSNAVPFTVLSSTDSNGNAAGVYIDTGFIKNAAITNAQIGNLSADKITTGGMNAARITAGTIDAARIDASFIQSTDLSTSGSTTINGANITTGTIDAARLDADVIVSTDLGASGSTVIDGSRITTGLINADRINVTDLVLPTINKKVTGTAIGGFANNTMRLAQVGEIGTEPGVYMGYVRVFGGTGQVKTLSIACGDGTYGSSGTQLLNTGNAYSNDPNSGTLPMADTGGLQYHSNRAEYWSGIARFQNVRAIAQISVTFIKRSANTVPTHLYVHAQGDGGLRYLTSVEYAFQRLALNQPNDFTFTDVTGATGGSTNTSNTITLTGSGFSGGTATVSAGQYKLNNGNYTNAGSFTVSNNDTVTLRLTASSTAGASGSSTLTVAGVSDTYTVATAGGSPPSGPPPGGGGGGGPGGFIP